jgi:hypothetical protein
MTFTDFMTTENIKRTLSSQICICNKPAFLSVQCFIINGKARGLNKGFRISVFKCYSCHYRKLPGAITQG